MVSGIFSNIVEASQDGNLNIVKRNIGILKENKVWDKVKHTKLGNKTLLHLAASKGHYHVTSLLIEEGLDVNSLNDENLSPAHEAFENDHSEVTKLLVEKGADINQPGTNDSTLLVLAAEKGNKEFAEYLLSKPGIDANQAQSGGFTALYLAAYKGDLAMVKLLVRKGAPHHIDINKPDDQGISPLYRAVQKGHSDVVEHLLSQPKINVNQARSGGFTPLYLAAYKGDLAMVKLLVEKGAPHIDINKLNSQGISPLHSAVQEGHSDVVEFLLSQLGINVNQAQSGGFTPLYLAAYKGDLAMVKLLVEKGAPHIDINKPDDQGISPLYSAIEKGHSDVVEYLLSQPGIDVNQAKLGGFTPLYLAAYKGDLAMVKLLVGKGASHHININKLNNQRVSPLHIAIEKGHLDVVKFLLSQLGIIINQAKDGGFTPLYLAAEKGDLAMVKLLVRKGAPHHIDINKPDDQGISPLYRAVQKGHLDVVKFLLSQPGININQAQSEGFTPLHVAAGKGNLAMVKLLVEKGAPNININELSDYGPPLNIAVRNGHLNVAEFLLNLKYPGQNLFDDNIEVVTNIAQSQSYDIYSKMAIIGSYVAKSNNKIKDLTSLIKLEPILNNFYEWSANIFILADLSEDYIKSVAESLYPTTEVMRVGFFGQIIKYSPKLFADLRVNPDSQNDAAKGRRREQFEIINNFTSGIENNDFAIDFLATIRQELKLTDEEFAKIARGRIGQQFSSIAPILESKSLGCLNDDGQTYFREELAKYFSFHDGPVTLMDIFSILKTTEQNEDGLVKFISMVRPETLLEIGREFKLNDNKTYLSDREGREINKILEIIGIEIDFPEVRSLCNYFKNLVNFPKITPEYLEKYKINFKGSDFDTENVENDEEKRQLLQKQNNINEEFKRIIAKEIINENDIDFFFKEILKIPEEDYNQISSINKEKLVIFFNKVRPHLCLVLYKEEEDVKKENLEGGLKNLSTHFNSLIYGLSDGCVNNFSNQFIKAVYALLIKQPEDKFLFSFFDEHIVHKILDSFSGGDPIDSDFNPLENKLILPYLISPVGFVNLLTNECKKNPMYVWEHFFQEIVINKKEEFEAFALDPNHVEALPKLACYLMIRNFPEIIDSRYLEEFKKEFEPGDTPIQTGLIDESGELKEGLTLADVVANIFSPAPRADINANIFLPPPRSGVNQAHSIPLVPPLPLAPHERAPR